jgi:hypothetical protein
MKSVGPCGRCGCEVWLPDALETAARHSQEIWFYCSYGHILHFPYKEKIIEHNEVTKPKTSGNVIQLKEVKEVTGEHGP